jgi:hypothetical protein
MLSAAMPTSSSTSGPVMQSGGAKRITLPFA